jgi:hypothetical protein
VQKLLIIMKRHTLSQITPSKLWWRIPSCWDLLQAWQWMLQGVSTKQYGPRMCLTLLQLPALVIRSKRCLRWSSKNIRHCGGCRLAHNALVGAFSQLCDTQGLGGVAAGLTVCMKQQHNTTIQRHSGHIQRKYWFTASFKSLTIPKNYLPNPSTQTPKE